MGETKECNWKKCSPLIREPSESDYEYHKRLVEGKLVDKTLAEYDYAELAPLVYGKEYSTDVARRMMYGSCKTIELLDSEREIAAVGYTGSADPEIVDMITALEQKKIELQKERQKFFDERNAYNKVIRDRAREEELNEILENAVKYGTLPRLEYEETDIPNGESSVLVSLNDIHYGANVDNYWNKYNSDICAEMMSRYLRRVIKIAELHGSDECIVYQNGDSIHGNIHYSIAVTNKEAVIDQIKGVSELIAEFLAQLSRHFNVVKYVSVSGNHSRLNPDKSMVTTRERLDDLVEWYLKARLQGFENVVIGAGERIDDTIYTIDVRGKTYAGVHGDYDDSASKVQTLQTMVGKKVYAVLSGHLHHNKVDSVQGVKAVMSGSFIGMDDYCVSKRIVGRQEQIVCVCDDKGIICHYDIPLSE